MSYKYLAFDLETIPQDRKLYSLAQNRQLEKKKTSLTTMTEGTIMGTDPFLGKIIAIGFYYKNNYTGGSEKNDAIYGDNELDLLNRFWEIIASLDSNTKLLTFNGFNFDIPWIRIRSLANGIKIPKTKVNFFNINPFRSTPHVDLMIELKGDKYNRMISVGLGLACETCGVPSPKDGIDGSQVYDAWKEGRIEEIASYVKRDVVATGQLFEKLVELKYRDGV